MQIVIDTNIIISSLISQNGVARKFMNNVFDDIYDVIVTNEILEEYERKMKSPKFRLDRETIKFVMEWFRDNAILVELDSNEPIPYMDTRDETDKKFYWAAKRTKSKLVTGNIKHYPVEEWRTMLWELQ
ncbi:MAG: putative toxin-antitoxin system toxin component, PIN family [Lachnospiraceae bacterium]|nr:putative toxin-antitoxin system toxin component, PIN family [Lachnospiraceae bacterium]